MNLTRLLRPRILAAEAERRQHGRRSADQHDRRQDADQPAAAALAVAA